MTASLRAQLTAALPGVTVLPPDEIEVPLRGGKAGQPGGLTAYLNTHGGQYVQIEPPVATSSSGAEVTFWVVVAAVATTEANASALAERVRLALAGDPVREPGIYDVVTASVSVFTGTVWINRPTYSITLIAGQSPA